MSSVLIVDDCAVDRNLVAGLLNHLPDLRMQFAVNGRDAWQRIQENPPDLVLTDLVMPEMDGLELVSNVVNEYPHIPIILITGQGSEQTAVQALQSGAASYVPKRVITTLLASTVENVLEAAREEKCQNRLLGCLTYSETTFHLANDPSMIGPLVNYLHRTIRAIGLCDQASGIRVSVALEEALNNALFHGNLDLKSDLRNLPADKYQEFVGQRIRSAPFCTRSIHVRANITPEAGTFVVRDEGSGFDPKLLPDPTDPENIEKASGRGLLLMHTFMDSIEFNKMGNEVTMIKYGGK
ncbi:MAG: response regulator [Planctomycetota bacterium]